MQYNSFSLTSQFAIAKERIFGSQMKNSTDWTISTTFEVEHDDHGMYVQVMQNKLPFSLFKKQNRYF